MIAPWPTYRAELADVEAERAMNMVMEAIKAVRNVRAELGVAPSRQVECHVHAASEQEADLIRQAAPYFRKLQAFPSWLSVFWRAKPPKAMTAVVLVLSFICPLAASSMCPRN